jgi:hypothetical protein
MAQKIDRRAAVAGAVASWDKAPMHIKAMAGAYMGPILEAMQALGQELDAIKAGRSCTEAGKCQHEGCNSKEDCQGYCALDWVGPKQGGNHG